MTKRTYQKYKLTNIMTQLPCGTVLYRIMALKDIRSDVKKGDLGGWVESMKNLSPNRKSWIYPNAKCYGRGRVKEDAILYDRAIVRGRAFITNEAKVGGTTIISGVTEIGEDTWLYGSHEYDCRHYPATYPWKEGCDQLDRGYSELHVQIPEWDTCDAYNDYKGKA